jgi:hypothetical protein
MHRIVILRFFMRQMCASIAMNTPIGRNFGKHGASTSPMSMTPRRRLALRRTFVKLETGTLGRAIRLRDGLNDLQSVRCCKSQKVFEYLAIRWSRLFQTQESCYDAMSVPAQTKWELEW